MVRFWRFDLLSVIFIFDVLLEIIMDPVNLFNHTQGDALIFSHLRWAGYIQVARAIRG
jgi:hypothetical protein